MSGKERRRRKLQPGNRVGGIETSSFSLGNTVSLPRPAGTWLPWCLTILGKRDLTCAAVGYRRCAVPTRDLRRQNSRRAACQAAPHGGKRVPPISPKRGRDYA